MANKECARCHRFFEKVAFEEVCPTCFPIEEEEFSKIKEYLTAHPGASSNEVMNVIGVTLKSIRRYLKEDRLEIVGDNKGFIRCELCGHPINSGRFCDGCYKEGQALKLREAGIPAKGSMVRENEDLLNKNKKSILFRDNKKK